MKWLKGMWRKIFGSNKGSGKKTEAPVDSIPIIIPPVLPIPEIPTESEVENFPGNPFNKPWKSDAVIVIDAYEKNPIDWDKMATDKKVAGVIHRSSHGLTIDNEYKKRKAIAIGRGYLWGAYHLGKRGNTIAQADLFLSLIGNDFTTLMCLDLEDTSVGSMMSIDEAVIFMNYVYEKTGRVLVVYANDSVTKALNEKLSGNRLFQQSKLWYARFKENVTDFPSGIWTNYFLWQFSSEINCKKTGSCLYNVPGTLYDMDINVFFGSKDQLKKSWNNGVTKLPNVKPIPKLDPVSRTPWINIAEKEIGQKEMSGASHNKRILEYHAATSLSATTDEVPWCASFVSWCLEKSGTVSAKTAWARSYLNWGKKIEKPVYGCVAVFKRGKDSGHVAFFVKEITLTITVLGGNQDNKVCESDYLKTNLLGYRLPS